MRHLVAMLLAIAGAVAPAGATVLEIGDDGVVRTRDATPTLGWSVPSESPALQDASAVVQSAEAVFMGAAAAATSLSVPVDIARRLTHIPAELVPAVLAAAKKYDISPMLIDAVARQESGYRINAVSRAGAIGVMQLMPETARLLGVNPYDPHQNIDGGARYLRLQLNHFNGDVERALAAYNAGPGRVERAGGIPQIAETQDYVRRIMGRLGGSGAIMKPTAAPSVIQVAQTSREM